MCDHKEFNALVNVMRLEDTGQFMAEITIECRGCGIPMQFIGLEPGLDMGGPTVSVDGLEARLAICPKGSKPNPMQRMAYGINRFDG